MNKVNIKKAIAIMERAKRHDSLFMPYWQMASPNNPLKFVDNEQDLHTCGNRACFAGHVAVSPEFQMDGGSVTCEGEPRLGGRYGAYAIQDWLQISQEDARGLVFGNAYGSPCDPKDRSHYYGKMFRDVTARDVIAKLEQLLERA